MADQKIENKNCTHDQETYNQDDDVNCGVGQDILNYFENLNWHNTVHRKEYKNCMKSFIPDTKEFPSTSHALRLVDSQLIPFPEEEIKIPPLPKEEVDQPRQDYIPGVETPNILPFPQYSLLTRNEQYALYFLHCKRIFKKSFMNPTEQNQYKELMQKTAEDKIIFCDFVQSQWIKHMCVRTMQILPDIERYIHLLWQKKVKQCLALYPALYKTVNHIPLVLNDANNDFAELKLSRELQTTGGYQKLCFPKLKSPCLLVSEFDKMCEIKPVIVPGDQATENSVNKQEPVSVDPVVDYWLEKENIDVVITPSGVKAIVDNHMFRRDWVLPVTVKSVFNINGESSKKVVIVDKILPPVSMSVHDKNLWHAKLMSKWVLNPRTRDGDKNRNRNDRELIQYDQFLTDDLELFGAKSNISLKMDKAKVSTPKEGERCNSKDDFKNDMFMPGHEYKLWELHKSKHFNMSKEEQRSLKVMVRHRRDGKLRYTHFNSQHYNSACVSSKLEFQPEYGASKMDRSELIREYIDLYLRHDAVLLRVRSVGHTKEVMLTENKSLTEIRECLQAENTQVRRIFDPLYAVLTKLIDLPAGKYMLQHTAKMGAFAQLTVQHPQGLNFNLINYCYELRPADINVPAPPIDPFVLTAIHHYLKRPPTVLQPYVDKKKYLKKTPLPPRRNGKGKKKKKKKAATVTAV